MKQLVPKTWPVHQAIVCGCLTEYILITKLKKFPLVNRTKDIYRRVSKDSRRFVLLGGTLLSKLANR
jgi:hypothetical protein